MSFSFFLSVLFVFNSPLIWKICLFALFDHWAFISRSAPFSYFPRPTFFLLVVSLCSISHTSWRPHVRIIRIELTNWRKGEKLNHNLVYTRTHARTHIHTNIYPRNKKARHTSLATVSEKIQTFLSKVKFIAIRMISVYYGSWQILAFSTPGHVHTHSHTRAQT